MSVAKSSAPSRETATFWTRAPGMVSLRTMVLLRRSTVVIVPASRAATYMHGATGWNATPVSRSPVALTGSESITSRVDVLMT